jgi:hypothetical protein
MATKSAKYVTIKTEKKIFLAEFSSNEMWRLVVFSIHVNDSEDIAGSMFRVTLMELLF